MATNPQPITGSSMTATGSFAPTAPGNPITVDTLGQNTPTPITLPPPTPYTPPVTNVPPPAGTTTDANGKAVVPPANSSATSQVQSLIDKLGTEGDTQTQLETAAGTDDLLKQKTADFNAYNQAKIDQTNTIAQMKESGAGAGDVFGMNANIAKYQLESDAHISNLAIQSQISSGNYTDAENTITKKLDAMFTPIKDQISALSTLSTMENNDMTDSEKLLATQKADQLKTDSANVQSAASDIQSSLLKNGSYSAVAPKIDSIIQDYSNGKITADEAQSQMYAAASPFGSVSGLTSSDYQDLASTLNDYNGQKYVTATDLTGYTAAQKGQIIQNLKANGIPTLTPKDSDALDTIQGAKSDLQSILTDIQGPNGVLPNQGGFFGIGAKPGQEATVKLNDWFQTNPSLGSFDTWQASIVSLIGGLKGVSSGRIPLSSLNNILPQSTDTLQTAQGKITKLNTLLDNGANSILGTNNNSTNQTPSATVQSNGKTYNVGQVYNDGTANWTVDASGKWTKQ